MGLKASVAGITIVALGTSLPDTFASRTAALHDDGADAAIGNVTGFCHLKDVRKFSVFSKSKLDVTIIKLCRVNASSISSLTLLYAEKADSGRYKISVNISITICARKIPHRCYVVDVTLRSFQHIATICGCMFHLLIILLNREMKYFFFFRVCFIFGTFSITICTLLMLYPVVH